MKPLQAVAVLSVLLISACAKPTEAECNALGDHVTEIMVKEVGMEGMDDAMLGEIRKEIEPERVALVEECKQSGSKSEVECFMKAESIADIDKCE